MPPIASGLTYDLPNFVGELFGLTPTETPLLSMVGGLTGGKSVRTPQFTWQTYDNAAAEQPNVLEGDDPVYAQRVRAERKNVVQIFQYGWQVSYSKLAAVDQLSSGGASPAIAATSILGNQPVQNELTFQQNLKIERAKRDAEFTFLHGVFAHPNDNQAARRSRGINTAITTNAVAAGGALISKALVDELLLDMFNAGAPFRNPVMVVNAVQKFRLSEIYGFAPESRTVGGLNIQTLVTDLVELGIVVDRHQTASVLGIYDLAYMAPVLMEVPTKGHFFVEPMPSAGAYFRYQLYGEIGLASGPEEWHGKITGLAT